MTRHLKTPLAAAALAFSVLATAAASAQRATAVRRLDLDKLTGTWYEIAKLPIKAEKKCLSDDTLLYALSDKANTFQIGDFCTVKGGDHDNINNSGKQDKQLDGKLKIRHWVLFHRPYWVLATDPNYNWALVGTPNHKSLWILARQATLPGDTYSQLQQTAAAQGFPVAKLVLVTHPQDRTTLASPSANPNQIESPTPGPTKAPAQPSSTAGKP